MKQNKEHKKGLIGTITFHVIILILLVFLGFFTPLPLPGEEGILVNFGNSENGLGDREPSPAKRKPKPPKTVQKEQPKPEQKKTTPPVTTPPPPKKSTPKPQPAKEVVMTQDYEKTAAIATAEKKKEEEKRKRQQEIDDTQRKQELEDIRVKKEEDERIRKQQEEIDRKLQEETERIAKEIEEKQAREEAARIQKEKEQQKIDEINSRMQGAFANSGSGSGGEGNSTGKSQGATYSGGNQGVPTGDPNANNYGPGGSGSGNQGSGVSFSLSGRTVTNLPKPEYPGDETGVVVVKITVDRNGRVTSATPGISVPGPNGPKTTIMDDRFFNAAKQAALKAKFDVKNDAAVLQQGTISYRFVLD